MVLSKLFPPAPAIPDGDAISYDTCKCKVTKHPILIRLNYKRNLLALGTEKATGRPASGLTPFRSEPHLPLVPLALPTWC